MYCRRTFAAVAANAQRKRRQQQQQQQRQQQQPKRKSKKAKKMSANWRVVWPLIAPAPPPPAHVASSAQEQEAAGTGAESAATAAATDVKEAEEEPNTIELNEAFRQEAIQAFAPRGADARGRASQHFEQQKKQQKLKKQKTARRHDAAPDGCWSLLAAVHSIKSVPLSITSEVALLGRSNVGKSSLLNALTRSKNLARTSNTPGRTQALYAFSNGDPQLTLFDLPGVGFAKAPKHIVAQWNSLIDDFLQARWAAGTLKRVFYLVDSRHGLKAADTAMLDFLHDHAIDFQLVLTKIDKRSPRKLGAAVRTVRDYLQTHPNTCYPPYIHCVSSVLRVGIPELQMAMAAACWTKPYVK
jgi:GTP-binding protein